MYQVDQVAMSKGGEEISARFPNMELAKIVKEQVVDNKKLRVSLDQMDKENAEKDRLIKSMLERLIALEKKDKSIILDEEIRDEEEEEEPKEEEVNPKEVRMAKLEKIHKEWRCKGKEKITYIWREDG